MYICIRNPLFFLVLPGVEFNTDTVLQTIFLYGPVSYQTLETKTMPTLSPHTEPHQAHLSTPLSLLP